MTVYKDGDIHFVDTCPCCGVPIAHRDSDYKYDGWEGYYTPSLWMTVEQKARHDAYEERMKHIKAKEDELTLLDEAMRVPLRWEDG